MTHEQAFHLFEARSVAAEAAGINFYSNNPSAPWSAVDQAARSRYTTEIERMAFLGGWSRCFWGVLTCGS